MGRYTIATSTRCSTFPSPRRCRARSSTPSALPWKAGTSRSDRTASGARRVRAAPAAAPWRPPPPLESLGEPQAQRAVAELFRPHARGRRGTRAVRNRARYGDLVVGAPPARQRGAHVPLGLVGGPLEDLLGADSSVQAHAPTAALQGVDEARLDHREAVRREVAVRGVRARSEEHTSELQSLAYLVCRLLLEKKKKQKSEHVCTVTC